MFPYLSALLDCRISYPNLSRFFHHHCRFVQIADICVPLEKGERDQVFVSRSYDATSHFETVCDDVKDVYKRVTGHDLVLKQRPSQQEEQQEMAA